MIHTVKNMTETSQVEVRSMMVDYRKQHSVFLSSFAGQFHFAHIMTPSQARALAAALTTEANMIDSKSTTTEEATV